jgi:glycosyltransferase involved in cell wall biosynthesis
MSSAISSKEDLDLTRKLLVFNSAYTFHDIKSRGLEVFISARDAGEFFDSVLTVSPIASLQYSVTSSDRFGKAKLFKLDARNTILEGKISRFHLPEKFKIIDFLFGQFSVVASLVKSGGLSSVRLVRAEDPRFNGLYGLFFSRLLRKPLVIGVWGNPARIRESTNSPLMPNLFRTSVLEEKVEKFVLKRASMVLAQNKENMSYALTLGVHPDRTRLTPLGVGIDSSHFVSNSDRYDVSSDLQEFGITTERIVVCVSRLEKVKFVEHAVRACVVLSKAGLDFKMVIVGDGREKPVLANLAKSLGISNNIVFAGNRSQVWLSGFLARADIAIVPLAGRALLEIGLAGCPVVAYDVDWHSEIVRSGITGTLVENLNYEELGKAALKLLSDDELISRMNHEMKTQALEIANPKALARVQADIYKELIEEN